MSQFYSPYRVQADQKEVIISQLKGQLYNLKKNQQEYYHLEDQFKKLQQKYRLLQEDKIVGDNQFRSRHELALRNISQLKNEADALKADLRQRNLELGDLDADGNTLKTQLDQRNIQIQRLKNDANSLLADNEELLSQRARLEHQFSILKTEKIKLLQELKNLEADNDSVNRKTVELEKYLNELDHEGKNLRDRILHFENQNNSLDSDINANNQDLAQLQKEIIEATKHLKDLQHDLAELLALNDKNKSQALHFHKATQAQLLKNNDLAKTLAQAENTLRTRDGQISEGKKELENLNSQNRSLSQLNKRLDEDLQACRKHLENLAHQNSHLLAELERFSVQDESVRALIDRKNRIIRSRARVEETVSVSRATAINAPVQSRVVKKSKIIY